MNARTSNDSNFRYGHFTNSCLEIFDKVPVLEPIISSHVQEVFPSTSLDESSIEFEFQTDRSIYLDMRDTHLMIQVELAKGRLFDTYKKRDEPIKKVEHKEPKADDSNTGIGASGSVDKDDDSDFGYDNKSILTCVNNLLHSLFSNCEVYLNNQQVYNSNGLYAHKAFISNEFNSTMSSNDGILHCHGYEMEINPRDFEEDPFYERQVHLNSRPMTFYGKLAIDLLTCDKLLLPNTKVRLKLIRARPNFYMISDNPHVSMRITDCSLFTRRVVVAEQFHSMIEYQLIHQPALYNFMETVARTFIIPSQQNQFIQENIFHNAPIRRLAIAMNTNSAFTGSFDENPFHYQKFDLREIRIVRGGRAIVSLDTREDCRAYVTTMKAMNFNEDIPALPLQVFQDHYILVFDLTSLQDAGECVHYPELTGESIRLELFFEYPLENVTEIIVLGERISTVKIDKFGTVGKNV